MPKLSADLLVFDLDGTLIDSKKDIANAFNCVLKELNRPPMSNADIAKYIGVGVQSLLKQLFESEGPERFNAVLTSFAEHYWKNLLVHTKVYDGIFDVLEHFREKPKVILTNKRQRFAGPTVEGLKLTPYFLEVYGREYFPTSKPDPGPLFEISRRFSIPLSRIVMIGDTEVDLKTGKGAGTLTAAAAYGYGSREELAGMQPDVTLEKPEDLMAWF